MRVDQRVLALALAFLACCAAPGKSSLPAGSVVFEGNASISDATLLSVVARDLEHLEKKRSPRAAIDDAAFRLEQFYRSAGFAFSEVEYDVDEPGKGDVRARFKVFEGPRTILEKLAFEGNHAFGHDELAKFLPEQEETPAGSDHPYYVARAIDDLVDGVAALYRVAGFRDCRVLEPRTTFDADKTHARVVIAIEEGTRYVLRELSLEGGIAEIDARLEWGDFRGAAYSTAVGRALRGRIEELYGRSGYPDAKVELDDVAPPTSGGFTLRFSIDPGDQVTITGVRIVGGGNVRSGLIESCIVLAPGELYDVRKERESFRKLYRTGLFARVRLDLEGAGSERELLVDVEEAASTELYVEPGYGSYERFRLGLGWREKNIFGTGRIFDFEGTAAVLAQRASVGLTDPRFLDSDVESHLSLFTNRREEPSFTSFDLGTALAFTKRYSDDFSVTASYQYRRSEVSSDDLLDPAVQAALANVDISSILLAPAWDTRDSPVLARKGTLARGSVEFGDGALGSELDFLRLRLSYAHFFELSSEQVLGLSWRTGVIAPIEDTTTIPIQERFFNGGENTVRSFGEQELGPVDSNGNPIGGEAFNVLSAELRQHLRGNFEGALFFDTGNLIEQYEEYFLFEGFRHALGVGLRYLLPVGPVRLDVGFNPDPQQFEPDYTVHFSVGLAF